MKLRIRANSIRLRLNQKEVESLASGRILKEKVDFPGGTVLAYSLQSHSAADAQAFFAHGSIQIHAPVASVKNWAGGEELGLYYTLPTGEIPLKVAIEKDLACVDGPADEQDPYAFPRAVLGKVC